MNISRENLDELNAVVKVAIEKEDYEPKVAKILKDYRKTANIPGFRKGHVPMGLVKKQYGQAVLVDEINKLLQESLNKYLNEEKLDVLGNPLPKEQKDFSWDAESYTFEFELGLAPEFDVDLKGQKPVTHYKIIADDKMIDRQIEHIQKQYGKLKSMAEVVENSSLTGIFKNEDEEIDAEATFSLDTIKGKDNQNKFIGTKVGDSLSLKTKSLFKDGHDLAHKLGISHEKADDLDATVSFEITEIHEQELAAMDQVLFDKVYGKDTVKSEEEFRDQLKEDAEAQFAQQSDQQLLNDVAETLIEGVSFDLPHEFLQKWIRVSGKEELSVEEAKKEYENSEKALRFQLIENKLMTDNDLTVGFDDVFDLTKARIKMQMAQFGQANPTDQEVTDITKRVLANEEQTRNTSEQVKNQKLLKFYKENAILKEKEVTYDGFVKEAFENDK